MSSLTDAVVVQRETYRRLVLRKRLILSGLVILLMCSVLLDLALGPASYSLSEVLGALFSPDSASPQVRVVMWDIRLPVALMAVAVGAALGLAFGIALFPLAAQFMVPLNAFLMAMLSALLIHFLSMRRGVTAETIVLLGIALVFTFNALLALVQFFATEQAVAAVVFWTMGSLTKATWPKLGIICLVILVTLPIFAKRAWALTALRLGDDKAASFGINVRSLRFQTLIMVSLLASFPVAFVGTIGFIGLVGPHIARMLIGEDQRFFLPASLLTGSLILSASSVVSKTLIPGAIFPIGVVTSLIGVPFFISLILGGKKNSW